MRWAGRVLTTLVALMLTFSAVIKLLKSPDFLKEFDRLGWHEDLAIAIAIVELACVVLYVIPQTSILGAILVTGYLGGAIATHVRIGDAFIPPVVAGVLAWLGVWLRCGRLRAILPWRA
jgi:uncharacterized transporter YbjL